jgi:hypothetical protein
MTPPFDIVRSGLVALAVATVCWSSGARAAPVDCSGFRAAFLKATSGLKSEFVRPLTVSRSGVQKDDVFDLTSSVPADAVLTCSGETLKRFEINVAVPADPALLAGFARLQKAAMTSAFKWTDAHAERAMREINAEAEDYLKASVQRGDVVLAGKTEYHEGGGDLGMMDTPHRRTFVVVGDD